MIEILSYGNLIRCGKYNLHSRFNSAVNFYAGDSFVFVVNEIVAAGPLNIVVRGIDLDSIDSLEVNSGRVSLSGTEFGVDETVVYDSSINVEEFNYDKLISNLASLENAVKAIASVKSLAFILDPEKLAEFSSTFELEYVKRIKTGFAEVLSADILKGVNIVKGLGPGLTPSGDDFNSGLLIALNLAQKILREDYSSLIDSIYQSAKGNNPFTNAFLFSSANGFLSVKFKKLINSLLYGDDEEILNNTKQLLTIGATSGIDQAVGFITGTKRFLK
jgi:hypothetical protein